MNEMNDPLREALEAFVSSMDGIIPEHVGALPMYRDFMTAENCGALMDARSRARDALALPPVATGGEPGEQQREVLSIVADAIDLGMELGTGLQAEQIFDASRALRDRVTVALAPTQPVEPGGEPTARIREALMNYAAECGGAIWKVSDMEEIMGVIEKEFRAPTSGTGEPVAWRVVCADGVPHKHVTIEPANSLEVSLDYAKSWVKTLDGPWRDPERTPKKCGPHRIEPLGVIG